MNAERDLTYRLLLIADVITLTAAFILNYWGAPMVARNFFGIAPFQLGPLGTYMWLLVVIVPAWVVVLNLNAGNSSLLEASPFGVAWQVLKTGVVSTALVAFYLYATKNPLSRIFILSEGLFSTAALVVEKTTIVELMRIRRGMGLTRRSVLIVGGGAAAARAIRAIRDDPQQRMEVWGCLADPPAAAEIEGVTVAGGLADYRQLIWKSPIEEVLLSPEVANGTHGAGLMRYCDLVGLTVRILPDYAVSDPQLLSRMRLDSFLDRPAITIPAVTPMPWQRAVKRAIDLIVSTILLLLLSPLLLLLAVAVKLSSPGPIFYRWRVMGKGIRPFTGYKFRTMVADADARKAELAARNEMSGPVFKITDDPRITPLGRFLRKYSLDELPQLWSVFKGEMSLVGPRPPAPHEFERFELWHRRKLSIKPGITCLWQVGGRNRVSHFDDWVTLDLEYIDNWSLWLDFKILARTALTVVRGTGV
ncbi:MAG TPA: sugar transferase [Candidatus Binataceae bacterium]|nr:sugar transferase [Candidatus Binataceae bacterium]